MLYKLLFGLGIFSADGSHRLVEFCTAFSISLNIKSRSFLSKRYSIMTFLNVAPSLKIWAVFVVLSKGYI